MSTTPGYVYVLTNRSMPGILKIGRTVRPPSERAVEISSATGVPTPFELVFDVLVPDCVLAERILHRRLEDAGARLKDNREFFEAPVREVIGMMLELRETMQRSSVGMMRSAPGPQLQERAVSVRAPEPERDELLRRAAELAIAEGGGHTSILQRSLQVGYVRAARLIDQLHDAGVLGPPVGSAAREVLVSLKELDPLVPKRPPN